MSSASTDSLLPAARNGVRVTTATSRTRGSLARYNTDLANNLGNLVARVTTIVATKCEGVARRRTWTRRFAPAPTDVTDAAAAWRRFAPQSALEATWGSSARPTRTSNNTRRGRWKPATN